MDHQNFNIDPEFFNLCFQLGRFETSHLLLMNNSALPWFVLVPETDEVELCDLGPTVHEQIFNEVRGMSLFVKRHFPVDKINVACNGNVIRQMHLHVVGRRFDDYCWPQVVWGTATPSTYDESAVAEMSEMLRNDALLRDGGYGGYRGD